MRHLSKTEILALFATFIALSLALVLTQKIDKETGAAFALIVTFFSSRFLNNIHQRENDWFKERMDILKSVGSTLTKGGYPALQSADVALRIATNFSDNTCSKFRTFINSISTGDPGKAFVDFYTAARAETLAASKRHYSPKEIEKLILTVSK